ncbi:MAG: SDR family oxidoreductase [Proteobacteria bacterium]|nr:SDR family oxidoreductase [Pseudomonadota bacterium]
MFDLGGKTALVTGATKGIGRAIAFAMAEAGAQVVVSSRDEARCRDTARAINEAGGEASGYPCNISHLDQLQGLVDHAVARYGRIDSLVCNAAVNPHYGPMATISEDAYDKIMATNVKSNLWLCNMVAPQMAERRDGSIIIISSIAGLAGSADIGVYGISKAAESQLARNLAVEWAGHNIRANCIAPGLVKTDFARALWEDPERCAKALEGYPLGRLGEPEDIAGAAVFLAARAGQWLTGQTIVIDGGWAIGRAP